MDTMEAVLHDRFSRLRILDKLNEQFLPDAELFAFAFTTGIHPGTAANVEAYKNWVYAQAALQAA